MTRRIVLDAGPLGALAHPRRQPAIDAWLGRLLAAGAEIVLPAIADFQVRRSFLLAGLQGAVTELNTLRQVLTLQAITPSAMLRAAELWADARRAGHPTADPRELDADVILAAQALEVGGVVATTNVGHLSRFVSACDWRAITTP